MKMLRTGIATLLFVLSTAAYGQTSDVPVPAEGDNVQAWFEQHIEADGWTVLGADSMVIALGSPDGITVLADGTLRATVRHEYYRPQDFGGRLVRSIVQTRIIDCAAGRQRIVSIAIFERSNMQGASDRRETPTAGWTAPSENSLHLTALHRICAAPTESARLN